MELLVIRDAFRQEPGMVGARWWNAGLLRADAVSRRNTVLAIAALGGAAVLGIGAVAASAGPPDVNERHGSLAMQQRFGWDFGAYAEKLVFDGASTLPFDRSALDRLASDVAPRQ